MHAADGVNQIADGVILALAAAGTGLDAVAIHDLRHGLAQPSASRLVRKLKWMSAITTRSPSVRRCSSICLAVDERAVGALQVANPHRTPSRTISACSRDTRDERI